MSVSEFQSYLVKYKKLLIIFVAIAILGCSVVTSARQNYTAVVYIKYLGEKADDGITENGKSLNPYEISSAIVVKNALEAIGESGAACEQVRKGISVTSIPFTSEEEKYESWKENFSDYDNTEEEKSQPVYYKISFTTGRGPEYAERVLDSLVNQYRDYYSENYASYHNISEITDSEILSYDYFETAMLLERKIKNCMSFLTSVSSEDSSYRSPETGYCLNDIVLEYDNLLKTELSSLSRNILENGISKNPQMLATALKNTADRLQIDSSSNFRKAETQKEVMAIYSEKNGEYIWTDDDYSNSDSHSADSNQVRHNVERDLSYHIEKSTYDTMILDYVTYAGSASDLLLDKIYNEECINYFSVPAVLSPETEESLKAVCDKYNEIYSLTEDTLDDYNEYRTAKYISVKSGICATGNAPVLLYYIVSVVLALGFGIVIIVFVELKRKRVI